MQVKITISAASSGEAPINLAVSIDYGVVMDFLNMVTCNAISTFAQYNHMTADRGATMAPSEIGNNNALTLRFMVSIYLNNGTASATVAGPKNHCNKATCC
jgi:hypothetical protein